MLGLGGNASVGIGLTITLNDRFSRNATAITNQMLRMGQSTQQVKQNMRGALSSLQMAGGVMAGIGYATYKGIDKTVKSFQSFEYLMKSVQATAGQDKIPAKALANISDAARKLGQEYGILPDEVAKAMYEMAKGGVDTEEKLRPMTKAVLQLSAATDEAAAGISENLVATLNTFSIEGTKASMVADMLAKSANLSLINVSDVMESIKYGSNTAVQLKIPLEQMLSVITLLGKNKIPGSSAGIYFQQMAHMLNQAIGPNPSKAQVSALAAMGISPQEIQEASKGMTDMVGLTELMARKTEHMDSQSKERAAKGLAQVRGGRALGVMMAHPDLMKEIFQGLVGARGYAESVAATKLDTLTGAQKKYAAAMADFKINVGAAFADFLKAAIPLMTKILKLMTMFVSTKAGKLFLMMAAGALLLVGAVGAVLLPLATIGLLTTNARGGFMALQTAATWAFNSIGSSITSATQRLRVFQAMQRANPQTGWGQYPAGTMINGRRVGGQIFNRNTLSSSTGMGAAGMLGLGAAGAGGGLLRLANGASILYGAFDVLSNFLSGRFKSALLGLVGGVLGFMIGGPLGVGIGAGLGTMFGGLFEDDESDEKKEVRDIRVRRPTMSYLDRHPGNAAMTNRPEYGNTRDNYYASQVRDKSTSGIVNIYVDGKKNLEKYINGRNEDIYVGAIHQ